ncbi:MAG: aspartate aminotransferase family protein, partial [Deltaproteobacteria bacterium]|nr:aspartate aminotransferase family protein [Deltaproteobacteria bacterium]
PDGYKIFTEGKGCRVTDITGKTYIDYYAGVMFNAVGYGRKEIADAVYKQALKLHALPTHELCVAKIELAKKLADITPGSLSKVFFTNSGTEAVETSMKIARQYHALSGFPLKHKAIVGGYRYHGSTYGSMSVGCRPPNFTWKEFEPLLPGVIHVPSPYCFRCEFGLKYPDCNIQCARHIEWVIQNERPETIGFFLDVTIATEYFTPPPPEYWPMVRSICNKYGILLILDEVVNGLGRNGKMFACNHWDVVPDILVLAKGLASGYVPIGATVVTKEVAEKFKSGPGQVLKHGHTFEGNPNACAAALANIEIIEKEKLVENSAAMGKYLFDSLQSLSKHHMVGEIRGNGIGLMCGVEFVKDGKNNIKFSPEESSKFLPLLKKKLRQAGLWGQVENPLPLLPSLIITKGEIDEIVSGIDNVIGQIEKEL